MKNPIWMVHWQHSSALNLTFLKLNYIEYSGDDELYIILYIR
jgi:hypothetical protein